MSKDPSPVWRGIDRRAELKQLCKHLDPDERMTDDEMDALVDPDRDDLKSLTDIVESFRRNLENG